MFTLRALLPALALVVGACASKAPPEAEPAARPVAGATQKSVTGATPSWEGTVEAGSEVRLYGLNGSIQVATVEGDTLSVSAHRSGADADEVKLEVVQTGDRVVICTVYPGGHCGADGYRGSSGGKRHHTDAGMDLEVRLPADVQLTARTVNGSIETRGVRGHQTVHTVNGNVDVRDAGGVAAETVNGSVSAGLAELTGDVRLASVNGGVRVELGPGAGAEISAECVSGNIRSDYPLTHQQQTVGARARGTLGAGGAKLELKTVNGSIEIERAEHATVVPARAATPDGGTSVQRDRGDPPWAQTLRAGLVI